MKRLLVLSLLAILILPLIAYAADNKKGPSLFQQLKQAGREAKESGKGFTNTLKKSLKQAGKAFSDAWHGFLDFLGFGTKDKNKKKDIPSENVSLYSLRTT